MNDRNLGGALIVNQNNAVRRGLSLLLEALSYQVVGDAADGVDAHHQSLQSRPDIAIIDVSLAGLDGFELLRGIKSALPRTAVIVYTMFRRDDWRREALRAGADSYILMDDPPGGLIAAIEAARGRSSQGAKPD